MKVEFAEVAATVSEVPFVLGGVYRCASNRMYYLLCECRTGGYQMSGLQMGASLIHGPHGTVEGMKLTIRDCGMVYIPGAVLHIPKEVG